MKEKWHYQITKRKWAEERRERDAVLRGRVLEVLTDHVVAGYRPLRKELAERYWETVNHKQLVGEW